MTLNNDNLLHCLALMMLMYWCTVIIHCHCLNCTKHCIQGHTLNKHTSACTCNSIYMCKCFQSSTVKLHWFDCHTFNVNLMNILYMFRYMYCTSTFATGYLLQQWLIIIGVHSYVLCKVFALNTFICYDSHPLDPG